MLSLKNLRLLGKKSDLAALPEGKLLINTINAYSYNMAQENTRFAEALKQGDVLIPDGMSIVKACRWLQASSQPQERIAGWDLFAFEMDKLNRTGGTCFFLGSSPQVLARIEQRAAVDYPHIRVVTYSPPYKPQFTAEENQAMIAAIDQAQPDLLWIGMTAPKQEIWAYTHWKELPINCHAGTIGAVFDFYAGTMQRAPQAWQDSGFEWLYRLWKEPRRLWKRYLIGNARFLWLMAKEKMN